MSEPHEKEHRHSKEKEPTAGPSADDRGHVPQLEQEAALRAGHVALAHDRHARILGVSVDHDRCKIIIGSGLKQGVTEGMNGFIPGPGGMLADFMVAHVEDRVAIAYVEATPDEVMAHSEVILNPSNKPAPKKHENQEARILGVSVHDGKTRITIGNGRQHGAFFGEKVVVIDANGRRVASTELDEVEGRFSRATVDVPVDHVQHGARVILNPTDHSVDRSSHKPHTSGASHSDHQAN